MEKNYNCCHSTLSIYIKLFTQASVGLLELVDLACVTLFLLSPGAECYGKGRAGGDTSSTGRPSHASHGSM